MIALAGTSSAVRITRTPGRDRARRAIKPDDARVRVAGAQHHCFQHALRAHVGHEAALAGEDGSGAQRA